ncbi:MAG: hypothetical protein KBC69_03390 [Candidatus Magasanikbacteria bacterium]|nr:hypothetical protein [Candidatus Magasanikbacteria bacterium]
MNISKQQVGKKGVVLGLLIVGLIAFGLVGQAKAAPTPVTVQFTSVAESSQEDNGAVAAFLSFTNASGVSVSHPKLKLTYQITGTASASDYVFNHAPGVVNGIIDVAAGTGNVAVLFGHLADTLDEPNETVIVKITSVSYTGNTPVVLGANKIFTDTILDDDAPVYHVQFQAPVAVSAPESAESLVYLTFTDEFGNNVAHEDVDVLYEITGTADSSDFTFNGSSAMSGTLLLPAGSGPYAFGLGKDDDEFELDENLTITITGVKDKDPNTQLVIGANNTFTRTILNDDFPQYVQFDTPSTYASESQATLVTLKLTDALGNSYSHPEMYVHYQLTGTADSSDFTFNGSSAPINTIIIPAGFGPYITFFIPVDDSIVEPDETVVVTLLSVNDSDPATDLRIGAQNTFTRTIANNDIHRLVQFRDLYTVSAEDAVFGSNALMFTDEYGNTIGRPALDVYYEITGTASSSDFSFEGSSTQSGVIHVSSGGSSDLVLNILNTVDELVEDDETVTITITDVRSFDPDFVFEIGVNNSWNHRIINDDTQLYLQVERAAISSVENQPTLDDFIWMKLVDDNDNFYYGQDPITVNYQYFGGTANPANDFTIDGISSALNGSVTLFPSQGKYAFPLAQVYDDVVEPDETVLINLVGAVGENNPNIVISRGESNSFTYTIVNDDISSSPAKR